MKFRERIAWLGRMPLHWKILFGSQAIIMSLAVNFRLNDIKRAKMIEEMKRLENEKKDTSIDSLS